MNKIKEVLEKDFTIKPDEIKKLVGEVNINYLVISKNRKFIFKESPYNQETADFSLDESNLLAHLSNKLPSYFQKPFKSAHGNYIVRDSDRIYRLLSYVEGELFINATHTKVLFESFGKLLARMDEELIGKSYLCIQSRHYDWDILQFDLNLKNIKYIEDIETKRLVEYFHVQYHEMVRPLLPELRYSIIHGDANDLNVLVKNNEISGVIDFGDSVYSILINELAVAITYAVLGKEDPIEWALPLIKGYSQIISLTETEIDILYYLIAARLSISLCHSAYGRKVNPENTYLTISETPVLSLLKKWISINPVKAANEFRKAAGLPEIIKNTTESDLKKRWSLLSKAFSLTYEKPIKIEKAAFQYMYDNQGRTFLDLRNNIPHVGHCHPKVVSAGQRAMAKLNTNTRYIYDEIHTYSEKLLAKFPDLLNKVFFVNSGSAAADLAARLAKTHTNRKKMMVMEHGYHGNTSATIDISHYKFSGKGGEGITENTLVVPIPESNLKLTERDKEKINLQKLSNYFNDIGNEKGTIAGFITEPIVSAAGQIVIEKYYLQEIYNFIRSQGGVFISDEVQTGFGRLGNYFWGFEYAEIAPDIVVLGKPIGNGHPMAAVVCTDEIAESFNNGMEFFSSFGGNPVACSIGEAVLDIIDNEALSKNASEIGNYLIEQFYQLRATCQSIGEIRGMGLSLGIEIVKNHQTLEPNTELAAKLVCELKNRNILVGTDGPFNNVFKLKPPLCFNKENANFLMREIKDLISQIS